jgi:Circularly permutated YpsA SLOG family
MLDRVFSGGQTGADQAGWRAAKACGVATGGWMPRGFLTEDGPRPEFAEMYGAVEMPTPDYPSRTRRNAFEASATIWFGALDSPGFATTERACMEWGSRMLKVMEGTRPSEVVRWLRMNGFRSLNVAGSRESSNPGIGARVEAFLLVVFRQLAPR